MRALQVVTFSKTFAESQSTFVSYSKMNHSPVACVLILVAIILKRKKKKIMSLFNIDWESNFNVAFD